MSKTPVKTFDFFKGATELHFMHYSRVAIILYSTELYKTAFSTYSIDFLLPKLPSAVPK